MSCRIAISAALLLAVTVLSAHPHVFLEYRLRMEIADSEWRALEVTWRFDEYFSAQMIMDYDADQNGQFDEAETALLHDEAFINTANYNYFLDLACNNKFTPIGEASAFEAWLDGDRLVYRFKLAIDAPLETGDLVVIIPYDKTNFINVSPEEIDAFALDDLEQRALEVIRETRLIEFEMYGELPVETFTVVIGERQ